MLVQKSLNSGNCFVMDEQAEEGIDYFHWLNIRRINCSSLILQFLRAWYVETANTIDEGCFGGDWGSGVDAGLVLDN